MRGPFPLRRFIVVSCANADGLCASTRHLVLSCVNADGLCASARHLLFIPLLFFILVAGYNPDTNIFEEYFFTFN